MISTAALFIVSSSLFLTCLGEDIGDPIGCFQDNAGASDLENEMPHASYTVEMCVQACRNHYYKLALISDASQCFCSSENMHYADGICNKTCFGNSSQVCGGENSYSVYDTGQRTPGPPQNLTLLNVTEKSLHIQWSTPAVTNGPLSNYLIIAEPVSTYVSSTSLGLQTWQYPSSTNKTELLNLHPGTLYNVSVAAAHSDGIAGAYISDKFWTEIGEPSPPPTPEILQSSKGEMVVKLLPAMNDQGPISFYHVVVIFGEDDIIPLKPEFLKNYNESREKDLPFYIAAELTPDKLKPGNENRFTVGDGKVYGKYYNPPLPVDAHVHVSLGVVSSLNGVTKANYAKTSHEQDGIVILNVGNNMVVENVNSGLEVGLSAAVGVFGTLLVLSIVVFFILRKRVARQARRTAEHQELSLEGPIFEVESSGYIHNAYVPEEIEERVDHYKTLKEKVWNIPRNFLDIQNHILGIGRYGNVMRGTVQQRGFPVPVAVHVIPDGEMIPAEKHSMLQDLGVLIRSAGGDTPNVIQLVGICESPETLYVMVEHHPASLKDLLLESRSLNHTPSGEDSEIHKVCSLPERQLLETAAGIARAMDYLSRQKIIHKQIAARNVLMAHGVVPKLTAFGIAQFSRGNEIPDYTRWTAQEIFRSGRYVSKSDVWSFGCLLWEISALGGTPYSDVNTIEVGPRVMRGLRLPQLRLVSDDLYQLMLQCWQVDLDERPSFHECACVLENLLDDSVVHLNLSMYMGFHYEQYIPDMERQ
ncbi:Putative tyrosine-protein kinase Wsck [Gryllus bimaculatus]|nr:Putative tyrosine-protein kinase Wsck [Gryllus bimaculatus]